MLRYRAGDAAAFEVLYGRHRAGLYRYLLRQTSLASVAEELFQDVWMKLIHARERYEVKASFKTWLYHLARNRLIDYYRRQGRTFGAEVANAEDELPARESSQPERQVQAQQQADQLLQLVQSLPETQREVFLLREAGGLGMDEIAAVTGVGREAVKSRLRYAFRRLRDGLREYR